MKSFSSKTIIDCYIVGFMHKGKSTFIISVISIISLQRGIWKSTPAQEEI